ncbi:MAG: restriction endonuclease, SacI family [Chloroflexi bacterium]|nr:restriction endonuclease, SacI family [Chloroflexota bacterium]
MPTIDHTQALELLNTSFSIAESHLLNQTSPNINQGLLDDFNIIFVSKTQSYREVLLGCVVAKLVDKTIDVHLPYVSHGIKSFNARDLDERVINPFLQNKHIPSSKGPYLSTFRRQVKFELLTRDGLRDKRGFDSLLSLIDHLAGEDDEYNLHIFLTYLLFRFVELREASIVPLTLIQRFSLEQYDHLFSCLLSRPSGGLFPVLLAVCMFETIKQHFKLGWDIQWQGINVADAASGVGGDITIYVNNTVLLAIEVTERKVDRSRLISTFNTKIAPSSIEDYLFLIAETEPNEEARVQAAKYFAQGHEINFTQVREWLIMLLATFGKTGRYLFNTNLMNLLNLPIVPQTIKVTWNECVGDLFGE